MFYQRFCHISYLIKGSVIKNFPTEYNLTSYFFYIFSIWRSAALIQQPMFASTHLFTGPLIVSALKIVPQCTATASGRSWACRGMHLHTL